LWEGADCIGLVQDRHRLWAAARVLMNLRVPLGAMNVLTGWESSKLSKNTSCV